MKLKDSLYSIISHSSENESQVFRIRLEPEHFIFKAHFPGEPITPGVCIMQIARELAEEATNSVLELSTVKNIKFLKIISPIETEEVNFVLNKISIEGELAKFQISVQDGENVYAKLSFVCLKK